MGRGGGGRVLTFGRGIGFYIHDTRITGREEDR